MTTDSLETQKQLLRQRMKTRRQALSEAQRQAYAQRMLEHLTQWERFRSLTLLHTFLSLPEEPCTQEIVEYCWQAGKKVAVPIVEKGVTTLEHSLLSSWSHVEAGPLGILQPKLEFRETVSLEQIALILVPGLAFDRQGGRLGYGGGFYDRFLPQTQGFRLGVAFHFQLLEQVPQSQHDLPMDGILTEEGFYFPTL